MSRVVFYILPDANPSGRLLLACRLAEKAYGLGHQVYIHAADGRQARQLDDLLWTFRHGSFVPHALCPPRPEDASPVLVGTEPPSGRERQVLINLSDAVPDFFDGYQRVVELVDQSPAVVAQGRERFRFYRGRGITPETHKL